MNETRSGVLAAISDWLSNRSGILAAISDWLKLLGLIVLAAEVVMLAAILTTPDSNPIAPWYPVLMLLFLLVLVVGLFWDQYMKSRSSQTKVPPPIPEEEGGEVVTVDTLGKSITLKEIEKLDPAAEIIEQRLGFTFHRPKLLDWSEPRVLTQAELLKEKGVERSPEEWAFVDQLVRAHPLGNMIQEAKSFILTCGDPTEIHLTDMTSTELIDAIIEVLRTESEASGEEYDEETITADRKLLVQGGLPIDRFTVLNSFIVNVYDKALAKRSPVEPNLGNVFLTLMRLVPDFVGTLEASKDSVVWSTSSALSNVLIRNQLQEIAMYRLYRLTESENKLFLVQIEYSPQTGVSPDVWRDLNDMLGSFNMIG